LSFVWRLLSGGRGNLPLRFSLPLETSGMGRNRMLSSGCKGKRFGSFVMQSNIGGVALSCLCWLLLLLSSPCTDGGGLPKRWGSQRSSAGLGENSAQLRLLGALRGGQLDGAEEEDEEDDQRIENVVVNQTEWLQAVGKASSQPNPRIGMNRTRCPRNHLSERGIWRADACFQTVPLHMEASSSRRGCPWIF
jgi:hypothetical protein